MALGQDPLQAVSGPRLHHQLLPDLVRAEHWNVTNTTGPSFMVSNAEVEVQWRMLCLSHAAGSQSAAWHLSTQLGCGRPELVSTIKPCTTDALLCVTLHEGWGMRQAPAE